MYCSSLWCTAVQLTGLHCSAGQWTEVQCTALLADHLHYSSKTWLTNKWAESPALRTHSLVLHSCSVKCAVGCSSLWCSAWSLFLQCAVCSGQCIVCSVQWVVYCVQCAARQVCCMSGDRGVTVNLRDTALATGPGDTGWGDTGCLSYFNILDIRGWTSKYAIICLQLKLFNIGLQN